jgi:ATP-dependent Clp protease ATP-binding subunit ClpC
VFERFTDRGRSVLILAREESLALNHSLIGTEHLLLGLIHEGEGVAAKALDSLGVELQAARQLVLDSFPMETESAGPMDTEAGPSGSPPFTPRARKVLELSLREALQLGHSYIGTEHILLGLVREGEGVGAQVLQSLGVELPLVREQVVVLLSGYQGPRVRDSTAANPGKTSGPKCGVCSADLTETARYRSMTIPPDNPQLPPITLKAVYCVQCGAVLGKFKAE